MIESMSTPNKDKVAAFTISDDMWPVIMGTADPVTMWKRVVQDYQGRGLSDAIKEVNAEAQKLGL
jgi:hypothetical protein